MSVNLLTEHHLVFLSLKEAAQAGLSLQLSKKHIFGNHMSRLKCSFLFRSSHKQRPSNKPISDKANISFTSPYGGNSPMSFAFTRWPVRLYKRGELYLVFP